MQKPEYYVYVYFDPRQGNPVYVGMGKGKRAFKHWVKGASNPLLRNILGKLRDDGLTPRIEFVSLDMNSSDAQRLERELIALYGRRDKGLGTLCNMTDGGDGAYGLIKTPEALEAVREGVRKYWDSVDRKEHGKKISQVFSSRTKEELAVVSNNIRLSRTEDVRKRIGAASALRQSDPVIKAMKIEHLQSAEARAKRRKTMKSTLASDEKRAEKRAISTSLWATDEYRKKVSAAVKASWAARKARANSTAIQN